MSWQYGTLRSPPADLWAPLRQAQCCSGWHRGTRPLFPGWVRRHSSQGALLSAWFGWPTPSSKCCLRTAWPEVQPSGTCTAGSQFPGSAGAPEAPRSSVGKHRPPLASAPWPTWESAEGILRLQGAAYLISLPTSILLSKNANGVLSLSTLFLQCK